MTKAEVNKAHEVHGQLQRSLEVERAGARANADAEQYLHTRLSSLEAELHVLRKQLAEETQDAASTLRAVKHCGLREVRALRGALDAWRDTVSEASRSRARSRASEAYQQAAALARSPMSIAERAQAGHAQQQLIRMRALDLD